MVPPDLDDIRLEETPSYRGTVVATLTHLPTGVVVSSSPSVGAHLARLDAMRRLQAALTEHARANNA